MGNCNFKADKDKEQIPGNGYLIIKSLLALSRNMFQFQYVIGRGGFGRVWKVEKKSTNKFYALKEMSKAKVIAKRSEQSVMNEKRILEQLKHP
jgi:serine/threonine protein kinase